MLKEEYVKDFNKKIIGILKTESNGDIIAMTFPARTIVGIYSAANNCTQEFPSRKIIANGNVVVQLLYKN